jgi:hypothetical protein
MEKVGCDQGVKSALDSYYFPSLLSAGNCSGLTESNKKFTFSVLCACPVAPEDGTGVSAVNYYKMASIELYYNLCGLVPKWLNFMIFNHSR